MSKNKSQLNGFLDAGSHLEGTLRFEHTFRIEGRLQGRVESSGDLYVGERGEVDGEINVARIFVTGRLSGTIHASERLEIAPGGRLYGEVVTPRLVIEEGAFFQGQSQMVEPEAAPGAESPEARVTALRRQEG